MLNESSGNAAEDFCSSREAAKLLDVSVKTAQLWVESGILQAWKTPGGHRRITRRSVDQLLSQRRQVLEPAEAAAEAPQRRILIVEDDILTRQLYQLTLSHWGLPLEVTVVRDGFEALLQIGERVPAVLITDLNMPGMDGFRLIAALRTERRYEAMKVIVVSGLTPVQISAAGGLPPSVPVLPKPIPFNDLRRLIEYHLVN